MRLISSRLPSQCHEQLGQTLRGMGGKVAITVLIRSAPHLGQVSIIITMHSPFRASFGEVHHAFSFQHSPTFY